MRKPPATQLLTMDATKWRIEYSVAMPSSPAAVSPSSWRINFSSPFNDPGWQLDYVLCPHTARITAARIEGQFSIAEGGVFDDPDNDVGGLLPSFRFIILKDLTSEFGRWWSLASVVLQPGGFTLSVPLLPAEWSSVYGKRGDFDAAALAGFQAALAAPQKVGLTFGAGNDFGHGITATGNSSITASNIRFV